jgi:hypothetical protein
MKIARRKSTLQYINDFQGNATAEVLLSNAAASGIPPDDVEVLDVTLEEFFIAENSVNNATRAQSLADEITANTERVAVANRVRVSLGLTVPEMKRFVEFIRYSSQ